MGCFARSAGVIDGSLARMVAIQVSSRVTCRRLLSSRVYSRLSPTCPYARRSSATRVAVIVVPMPV